MTERLDLWKRQAPEIEQALRTAAGPHVDRMKIAAGEDPVFGRPAIRVSFIATDEKRWNAHWEAMANRLGSVLPADSYIALDWRSMESSYLLRRQPD